MIRAPHRRASFLPCARSLSITQLAKFVMPNKNVMIFPGELGCSFFKELLLGQDAVTISCVILDELGQKAPWLEYLNADAVWEWDRLVTPVAEAAETPYHVEHYERVLGALLSDPRSFYILERQYRAIDKDIFFNSVFNRTVQLELVVWNTLSMLFKTRPDRFIHYNVPHGKLWFIAKVAELVGVDVRVGAISPLPWMEWVVRGLDDQQVVADPVHAASPNESRITDFIRTIRGDYAKAMPSYEKTRHDYFKGGFYSLKKEFRSLAGAVVNSRSLFTVFVRAMLSARKKEILNVYHHLSSNFSIPERFIVFFLHYQPERTSLPEGHQFAQQWLALRILANSLPPGYRLAVKEHPSTFRYYFNPGFRSRDFYQNISQLPNTSLVPLDRSPFDLIDKAAAVATITGTVGVEAIIRGKPVIVFGAAQYRDIKGVFAVNSMEGAKSALAQIHAGVNVLANEDLEDYFKRVDQISFDTDPNLKITSKEVMRAAMFSA